MSDDAARQEKLEKALRVLRVAVEQTGGVPGAYIPRARVMERADITDPQEFLRIARYLAARELIAEGVNDYEFFVLTLRGISVGFQNLA